MSWLEVLFVPSLALALIVGFAIGVRVALADHNYVIYWRQRAKSAEGELRALRKTPNVEVTGKPQRGAAEAR